MIKLVLFDLDGTLYSYEAANRAAERALLEQISTSLGMSDADARALLASAKKRVKLRLGNVASSHNRLLYMQELCELAKVSPLQYALPFYNVYWDAMLERMEPFPYVLPLFEELKTRRVQIGILTDLTAHIQYRKIERLGLGHYIDYFTTSEEAGEEKPSPLAFARALEKTPFTAGEVLMVGDDMEKDVRGAVEQGIHAVLYTGQKDIFNEVVSAL